MPDVQDRSFLDSLHEAEYLWRTKGGVPAETTAAQVLPRATLPSRCQQLLLKGECGALKAR